MTAVDGRDATIEAGADAAEHARSAHHRPPRGTSYRRRSWRHGERAQARLWHLLLVPLCAVWVYPFVWMVTASFKTRQDMLLGGVGLWPKEWTLENFARAWTTGRFGDYTLNTFVFSVLVVGITLVVSSIGGYALSDRALPGRRIVMGALVVTMFIPSGYTIVPLFQLISLIGLQNSLVGAALAQVSLVVAVLLYAGFFSRLPGELREAARVDGAGYPRTFFSIMWPLARPVTATVTIMTFIGAWNAFLIPLVFTLGRPDLRTLGVGMYNFFGTDTTDWTGLAAGATISVIPIVIVFLLLQKSYVEGIAGAVKN